MAGLTIEAAEAVCNRTALGRPCLSAGVEVYDLGSRVESRSISFENPTGEKGGGGKAASALGTGRKGSASRHLKPGETIVLCDIDGPGVIRHIWITVWPGVEVLQGIVIRAYRDNQEHPSVETPISPFFGVMHGQLKAYQSAVHSVDSSAGLNCWMEMPFRRHDSTDRIQGWFAREAG